jgi:hypothetical protein
VGPNHFKTLKYAYRKAPYFELYATKLQQILEARWERLVDLNMATLEFLREAYDIRTPLRLSSGMNPQGARSGAAARHLPPGGPDSTFLGGLGGSRRYLDQAAVREAPGSASSAGARAPVYPQCHGGPFVPGLTSLDLLFNMGPEARDILHRIGQTRDERIAA